MTTRNFLKKGILAAGALFLPLSVQATTPVNINDWTSILIKLVGYSFKGIRGNYSYETGYTCPAKLEYSDILKKRYQAIVKSQKDGGGSIKFYLGYGHRNSYKKVEVSRQQVKDWFGV